MERKYTGKQIMILKQAYNDYIQLKNELDNKIGNIDDLHEYINRNVKYADTIDFDYENDNYVYNEDDFNFYYKNMVLTIDVYNDKKRAMLSPILTIYEDEDKMWENRYDTDNILFDDEHIEKLKNLLKSE